MSERGPVGVREDLLAFLRGQYLGPASGPEEVLHTRPEHTYLVGTLYPQGPAAERYYGDTLGADNHDEELDEPIELANNWHPASAAISFLHDAPRLRCEVTAGTYEKIPGKESHTRRDQWLRRDWRDEVVLNADSAPEDNKVDLFEHRARLVCVWRRAGTAWLVTVALENLKEHDEAESPPPTEMCLFQAAFACHVQNGRILPYPSSTDLSDDPEDQELRLLYRHRRVYGVGHGCSVEWTEADGEIRTARTEMLPTTLVPGVARPSNGGDVLRMAHLADESVDVDELCAQLREFVGGYETWIACREREVRALEAFHQPAAGRLLARMRRAVERMYEGVDLLRRDPRCLLAFRLANAAMHEQVLQTRHVKDHPGELGAPLVARDPDRDEPCWYHFQLGFQLLSLASTADGSHPDRGIVDLIWFPTGGGKTEAYLGLAAFEMIRRRLVDGLRGGGTAILTRYTLRLLTSQQFQRAATLICALERLRERHSELQDTPPFSIGLWVGGDTTPNDYKEALERVKELFLAQKPKNPFQLQNCPWCGTLIVPERRRPSGADGGPSPAYGVRATKSHFELFCPHPECPFHEFLHVSVVDEQIFADPPTLLLATVDKLARLPWVQDAGRMFGRGVLYNAPSLVIQDELHLLSGPLGTTVALYEAAVHALLSWDGSTPKIVASTATIRAADHQVRSLYGAPVELFPPSGLDADDSYFARTDRTSPGRLYLGLMPQAFTQASATILSSVAILQAPAVLGLSGEALDAYWTLVIYHNSLRELGRTVTQVRDDVDAMLQARRTDATAVRSLRGNGVVELTSNVHADELPEIITRLEQRVGQRDAVDVLATTNMLSVGIDIGRLGVMLMNGQPKTTSEYIQATSRVGRSAAVPGLVVTLLRANKPRDRSHYESFRAYHESLYRHVEPTSVTPWSLASRERSLRAAFVLLVRHGVGLRRNDQAGDFCADDPVARRALARLADAARRADPDEAETSERELRGIAQDWHERATMVAERGERLYYRSREHATLLKDFGARGEGWPIAHSMRSVDRQVRILAVGEGRR